MTPQSIISIHHVTQPILPTQQRGLSLYLRTLGVSEIETSKGVVTLSTREAALLAYVSRKPLSRATRSELIACFWPTAESGKARHSLSQLLYALRNRVPDIPLIASAEHVVVVALDTDLLAINREVAAGNKPAALSCYKGRFLSNDDLSSNKLRDWRDEVEEEIALTVSDVLQEQSHVCAMADLPGIIQLSELLLTVHPHLIGAHIALIEATARTGELRKAERIYQSIAQSDADYAATLPPLTSFRARSAASPETHSVPFSGRDGELRSLLECWDRTLSGDGQVVVLLGEPGIGKTRLADQFLRRVAIRGGAVWIANCCSATQRLTYSVVNELIQEHVDPSTMSWRALPQVEHEDGTLMHLTERFPDEYRHRLTESLTSYMISRSKEQPHAILVDDAQWADEYTALLIAYWAYRLRQERVMIVLTVRTHEAEPPPDWILSDLGRPLRLSLGRISVAAAETIVSAFERHHDVAFARTLKDAVLWQSGGRPFLLLEALASLLSDEPASRLQNVALSEPAESLLLRRFRNLERDAADVVGILGVWGRPMPEATLRSMSGLQEDCLAAALNALHTRGIAHLHEGLISFPHDLMRETAYRSVLPATRVLYHRRAASELSRSGGPQGLIAQHYAQAGDREAAGAHSVRAADEALTSHSYSDYEFYCRLCIESGSERYRHQAAASLTRYLIQVGRSSESEDILPLLGEESEEHRILASISALERDLASGDKSATDLLRYARSIIAEVNSAEDPSQASLAATVFCVAFDACADEFDYTEVTPAPYRRIARSIEPQLLMESLASVWHGVTKDVESALSMAKFTVGRLTTATSPTTRAACLYSYGTVLLLSGKVTEARTHFNTAFELAQNSGDIRRQLSVHINNGVALMEAGELSKARLSLEKAVTSTNVHFRIRCYTNLSILHYEEGDFTLSAQAAQAVLSMNASYESPSLGSTSCAILGLIALRRRDYDAARSYAQSINQHLWSSLDDASYTAIFLSKLLIVSGQEPEAVLLLTDTINHTRARDVLCTMRLECEKARLLTRSRSDAAFRLARTVEGRARTLGAYLIESRAREVLTQIKTCCPPS
jgi:DNA-binding SARP family transcriptional activator